jgi:ribonucleotide reductase beta subunit family protein with ferritin-like domain
MIRLNSYLKTLMRNLQGGNSTGMKSTNTTDKHIGEDHAPAAGKLPIEQTVFKLRPIEYPELRELYLIGRRSLWTEDEVNFSEFVTDWETKLTEEEQNFIKKILKGFTITELLVLDHWKKVGEHYPRPEVIQLAALNSYVETVHASAYNQMEDVLDMDTHDEFLQDEVARQRFDNIWNSIQDGDLLQIALFSFVEGISLYSSFLLLLAFTYRKNLIRPIKKVIGWSLQDESLHAQGGIELSKIIRRERGYSWTSEEEKTLREALHHLVKCEISFIDSVFGGTKALDGIISKAEAIDFIYRRANEMLQGHNLYGNYFVTGVSTDLAEFISMLQNSTHNDFFAGKNSDSYTTIANIDWDLVKL